MKNKDLPVKKANPKQEKRDPLLDGSRQQKSKLQPPPKQKYKLRNVEPDDDYDE